MSNKSIGLFYCIIASITAGYFVLTKRPDFIYSIILDMYIVNLFLLSISYFKENYKAIIVFGTIEFSLLIYFIFIYSYYHVIPIIFMLYLIHDLVIIFSYFIYLFKKKQYIKYHPGLIAIKRYSGLTQDDCSICFEPLQDITLSTSILICGHKFHSNCINMWLNTRSDCPLCRQQI